MEEVTTSASVIEARAEVARAIADALAVAAAVTIAVAGAAMPSAEVVATATADETLTADAADAARGRDGAGFFFVGIPRTSIAFESTEEARTERFTVATESNGASSGGRVAGTGRGKGTSDDAGIGTADA
jgi:hypothetical protein